MSELILYQTEDGKAEVRLRAEDGSVWLSQGEIAELFATTKQNVSLHAKNILEEGELAEGATVKESLTVQVEGGLLEFSERPVLHNAGSVGTEQMKSIAHERYAAFDTGRRSAEALAADAEDLQVLEEIAKQAERRK